MEWPSSFSRRGQAFESPYSSAAFADFACVCHTHGENLSAFLAVGETPPRRRHQCSLQRSLSWAAHSHPGGLVFALLDTEFTPHQANERDWSALDYSSDLPTTSKSHRFI